MKKLLFSICIMILTFAIEYLCIKHVTLGIMLDNSKLFGTYTSKEKIESTFYFILPFIIVLIIQIISILIGKRIMVNWLLKDYVIILVTPIVALIAAFLIYVFLHP